MKCLIVAAGQGVRLRDKGGLKPLIPILGVPLIECVITRAHSAGVTEFLVVGGYQGEELHQWLDAFSARSGMPIRYIYNESWDRANGVSVLAARQHLDQPFLLTMCDHLVDPDILRSLMAAPHAPDTVTLAVDFNIEHQLNDLDDVTRVACSAGRIRRIGKMLEDFNAIDTGVFLCTPVMFAALEESQARGDDSISGAMNVLAQWNKALVFDIKGRLWVDVDDPVAFGKAENLLLAGRI